MLPPVILEGSLVFCVLTGSQRPKLFTNSYWGLTQGRNHLVLQRESSPENCAVKISGTKLSKHKPMIYLVFSAWHWSISNTSHQPWEQLYPIDQKICSYRSKYFRNKRFLSRCAGTTFPMHTRILHAPFRALW